MLQHNARLTHVPQSLVTAAPATVSMPRASHSQGLKHEYYYGSVRFNTRKFWADYRKSLPLHYAVYLAEVACKRAAAANVESVFSGAGKFTDEASSAGHVLLRRMVKLHYNWKFEFVRPTIDEVCERYKLKHPLGGARPAVAAPAPAEEAVTPQGGESPDE